MMKNKRLSVLLTFTALALASPCQAQQTSRQQNSTPQQALDKRQDAFQANKAKVRAFAMLTVLQLSKSFAGRPLFDDVSLQVNRGDRIGLLGPNGAGKSTLFALLLSDVSPDKGTIAIEKNATIGFLPQETAAAGDETVLELALAVSPALVQAQKVIKQHEAAVAGIADPGAETAYHNALHVFYEHG